MQSLHAEVVRDPENRIRLRQYSTLSISSRIRGRCQAIFFISDISDFTVCAHAQSDILHIKYIEKTDDLGSEFSVYVSVSG